MTEPGSNSHSAEETSSRPQHPNPLADASAYESTHVHSVYDAIADHFSATRYAPWPLVARFLDAQPGGSVGLDVGCGNGKYLIAAQGGSQEPKDKDSVPQGSDPKDASAPQGRLGPFMVGSDRSANLAKLAYDKHAHGRPGADVCLADSLALPFRTGSADFIICIAVVHHLSTRERRQAAVKELLRCVTPGRSCEPKGDAEETTDTGDDLPRGKILLYVWALEQATSRRGWSAGGEQDLLVPWVKTSRQTKKQKTKTTPKMVGHKATKEEEKPQQPGQPEHQTDSPQQEQPPQQPQTFQRYYHLYKDGELEEDVKTVGGRVVASGYEKDNWWVIADPV